MYFIKEYFFKIKDTYYSACFSSTYTKTGMTQRILACPPHKDDMQICEPFHFFVYTYGRFMLRFDRRQQSSVKQLSFNKKVNLKKRFL